MKKSLLLIILSILLITGCDTTCNKKDVEEAYIQFEDVLERWDDAEQLAGSTAKIQLSPQIERLQEIKRETEDIEIPECLNDAKGYLIESMNYTIKGYIEFMSGGEDGAISLSIVNGKIFLSKYSDEMLRISSCAPNCDTENDQ